MFVALPILAALSAPPAAAAATPAQAPPPAPAQQQTLPVQATEIITCPITGERISACCCPVKE